MRMLRMSFCYEREVDKLISKIQLDQAGVLWVAAGQVIRFA